MFNTVIVANAVCVIFDWQVEPLFLSLYSLELVLRLYGYGWQPFRRSAWNMCVARRRRPTNAHGSKC